MQRKIRWGILSTARIGTRQVIPAMQKSSLCDVAAIASRSLERARQSADELGIAKSYGSYEDLLADPEIDAVYNPLPNHLHVPVSIQALQAGKHVLCEKPLAITVAEAQRLVDAGRSHPRLKLMEAFMFRFHPQWDRIFGFLQEGSLGELREVHARFSYFNASPDDIRNQSGIGGGGLLDIGCYPISLARYVFGREPTRVFALVERDPRFGTDRYASAIVDFGEGVANFSCGTQAAPHQSALLVGEKGTVRIEWPFTPPADNPTRLWVDRDGETTEFVVPACDKYTVQADLFCEAILNDGPVPTPIDDAIGNLHVIEAAFRSGDSGAWENV